MKVGVDPPVQPPPPCIARAESPRPQPGLAWWAVNRTVWPALPVLASSFNVRSRFEAVNGDLVGGLYRR